MMTALYQPFIEVWTKGDPKLVRHLLTPAFMVAFFYVNQSRLVLQTFKSAAAIWKQDRWKPIASGAANLTMNISFVIFLPDAYKLDGVIFSTILGVVFIQIPWESHVVFSSFFGKSEACAYWRSYFGFAVYALVLSAIAWCTAHVISVDGITGLILKGAASSAAVFLLMFAIFRRDVSALLFNKKTAFIFKTRRS